MLLGEQPDVFGTRSVFDILEVFTNTRGERISDESVSLGVCFQDPPAPVSIVSDPAFQSLLGQLGMLEREFKKFKTTITGTVHLEMQQSLQDNLYLPSCAFQVNLAQPTIGFLKTWLSAPSTLGDKLAIALQHFEVNIASIKSEIARLASALSLVPSTGSAQGHPFTLSALLTKTVSPFGWTASSVGNAPQPNLGGTQTLSTATPFKTEV
ncbi:hypothetical protein ACA910_007788 [Epithemia clementina (nom. ined.)]